MSERGFSLLETMVALAILAAALLSMAGIFTSGMKTVAEAPLDLLAKQKATEAIESVYTARDTRVLTWSQIRNVEGATGEDGGVFVDGAHPLTDPGPDGLVNTADDGDVEAVLMPGPDSVLGTADDQQVPLVQFTREIRLRDVGLSLRELQVTITWRAGQATRQYVLTTLVSAYA